jgi:hypothetical protein
MSETKDTIKAEFEKYGIKVLRIAKDGNGYKVSISWKDYPKYRNTRLEDLASIAMR